jgi:hypothetical protein
MLSADDVFLTEKHNVFTCFASEVNVFRDGFPKVVPTSAGNGQPFIGHTKKVDNDGDLLYVRYKQQAGCIDLIVFNT